MAVTDKRMPATLGTQVMASAIADRETVYDMIGTLSAMRDILAEMPDYTVSSIAVDNAVHALITDMSHAARKERTLL